MSSGGVEPGEVEECCTHTHTHRLKLAQRAAEKAESVVMETQEQLAKEQVLVWGGISDMPAAAMTHDREREGGREGGREGA